MEPFNCSAVAVSDQPEGEAKRPSPVWRWLRWLLAGYALLHVGFNVFLWVNHANFPLNLEAMELTMVAHLRRLMAGLPLYVAPSADFVPLAYNPLYYLLCLPLAQWLGPTLLTMRLTAIAGMAGAGMMIFLVLHHRTRSLWWAWMGVGLFAAAYRVMDTYLDNAHADSWLLFTVLLAGYVADRWPESSRARLGTTLLLVSAFWFKQHGALFLVGWLVYLTWRYDWRRTWGCILVALLLGPELYLGMPKAWLGPEFHHYTWEVPRSWTHFEGYTLYRLLGFNARYYAALVGFGLLAALQAFRRPRQRLHIWAALLPIALVSGFMGALDDGSLNNVFIPMGTWWIILGVLGLSQLGAITLPANAAHRPALSLGRRSWQFQAAALVCSFVLMAYNPLSVIISPQAQEVYQDFVQMLQQIDGPVFAPWLGPLDPQVTAIALTRPYQFAPTAHWVPLQDLVRGSGQPTERHPVIKKLLASVGAPKGPAYILQISNTPDLKQDGLVAYLADRYRLDMDWGDRFRALATLPKRFPSVWPRYLFRYQSFR